MSDTAIWGRRNPKVEGSHWEKLDLSEYKMTKPVVVCLSGNGATNEKEANGFCKIAENLIGLRLLSGNSEEIYDYADLIGVSYANDRGDGHAGLTNEDRAQLVNNVLLPRCLDENGNALPIDDVCKNLSQVTFFSFCYGSKEVNNACSDLNRILIKEKGFTGEETDKIFESMAEISYSPCIENCFTPKITALSAEDNVNVDLFDYDFGKESVVSEKIDPDESSGKYFETINIYADHLSDNKDITNEHGVDLISRDEKWRSIDGSKNADCVSQMMSYALARSVANGMRNADSKTYQPKIPMSQLLEEMNSIKDSFQKESGPEKE